MAIEGLGAQPHSPRIVAAYAANSPASTSDTLQVVIPSYGADKWGPLPWPPTRSGALPKLHDECLVGFDERGNPWVVVWK